MNPIPHSSMPAYKELLRRLLDVDIHVYSTMIAFVSSAVTFARYRWETGEGHTLPGGRVFRMLPFGLAEVSVTFVYEGTRDGRVEAKIHDLGTNGIFVPYSDKTPWDQLPDLTTWDAVFEAIDRVLPPLTVSPLAS